MKDAKEIFKKTVVQKFLLICNQEHNIFLADFYTQSISDKSI